MFESTQQAINVLNDGNFTEIERERAILYLKEDASAESIDALIGVLKDGDAGVRWAASEALAAQGETAIRPMLLALTRANVDYVEIDAMHHALSSNASEKVRLKTKELQKQMHEVGSIYKTMETANKLLIDWK